LFISLYNCICMLPCAMKHGHWTRVGVLDTDTCDCTILYYFFKIIMGVDVLVFVFVSVLPRLCDTTLVSSIKKHYPLCSV
jgi:hypothetical protein